MTKDALLKFYEKNERYISPIALLLGFVWDNLTLRRIDLWLDNLVITVYLSITGLAILFLNAYYAGRLRGWFFDKCAGLAPYFMQFSFGGLFSAFLIFYSRSGALGVSWPFLFILVFFFIGNELFRKRYQRLAFQVSVFFVTIYAYLVFAVPILLDRLGGAIFVVSGLTSLAAIFLFILLVRFVAPQFVRQSWRWFVFSISVSFIFFNVLYFTNIIPPIPLSLKDGGIAHSISKFGFSYYAQIEEPPWYLFYKNYNPAFHWQPGQRVYCYAAVFAPTKINTDIFHRWSYYDDQTAQWIEKDRINYAIVGGKDGGYRGYSFKQNIVPGKWRVDVMTQRGQVLGRLNFEIIQSDSPPTLVTVEY